MVDIFELDDAEGIRKAQAARCLSDQQERRTLCHAVAHWNTCRNSSPFPKLTTLLSRPNPNLENHIYFIEITHPLKNSLIIQSSEILDIAYNKACMELTLEDAVPAAVYQKTVGAVQAVEKYGKPLVESGTFINKFNIEVLYRNALMPVANGPNAHKITHVFGAMSFRCVD